MDLELMVPVSKTQPVVMVDDSLTDIFIAKKCFQKTGYTNPFIAYQSGEDFLDYMREIVAGDEEFPALVLLDINMPKLTGFEVLQSVRQELGFEDIPTIMILTNSNHVNDRNKSLELGANGFQTKPHEMPQYLDFFRSIFEAKD